MSGQTMTPTELTFVKRMAFHVAKGLSFEDAGRAVLADDARIFKTVMTDKHAHYMGGNFSVGRCSSYEPNPVRLELAHHVHTALRAKKAA